MNVAEKILTLLFVLWRKTNSLQTNEWERVFFKIYISPNFQSKRSGIIGAIIFGFVMGAATSLGSLCCNPIFPVVM